MGITAPRPGRGPQQIGDVLANLIARRGYGQEQSSRERDAVWEAVSGQPLAAHSRPAGLHRGIWEVVVRDSATLQEVMFQKSQLLQCLIEKLPNDNIKDLRFRVGNVD